MKMYAGTMSKENQMASMSTDSKNKPLPFAEQNTEWRVQESIKSVAGFMKQWPAMFPDADAALGQELTDSERAAVRAGLTK